MTTHDSAKASGGEIWWSHDGENFNAHSAEEAAEYGELEVGSTVYYGEAVAFRPSVHADWIIDHLQEQAWDFAGEFSDDWLGHVSREAKEELKALIVAWAERHEKPRFHQIENVKEHVLTADDFAAQPSTPAEDGKV